jgi:hypothetical protein
MTSLSAKSLLFNSSAFLVDVVSPLTDDMKKYYHDKGITYIQYRGDLQYIFYTEKDNLSLSNQNRNLISIRELTAKDKIEESFLNEIEKETKSIRIKALLFTVDFKDEIYSTLNALDIIVIDFNEKLSTAVLKAPIDKIENLLALPFIRYVEKDVYKLASTSDYVVYNINAANLSNSNTLWNTPYDLSGKGVKVAIVDEGKIRKTHQEFNDLKTSRISIPYNSGKLSRHATHIAGIIGAKGINPIAHGMANQTELYSYYFNDFAFANAILKAYLEENILLSNHSYGYIYDVYLGKYNIDAMQIDKLVEENPFLNIFIAAGNDRNRYGYLEYGITKGPVNAKNILSIGSIDDSGNLLAAYSSTGPVADGRIKPDLVANGTSLLSTGSRSDNDYFYLDGTSMATPVATGIASLMIEEYRRITNQNIRHDLLKAIMINSAIDKGREGPDYEYGYGMINAQASIDIIKTLESEEQYIKQNSIEHNQVLEYCIQNKNSFNLKTTIVWIDPTGNPEEQDKTLVNDIDIEIVKDQDNILYPFSLEKENPTFIATQDGPNKIDNIEQIIIVDKKSKGFLLKVKGTQIITDKQHFSLVSNKPFINSPQKPLQLYVDTIDNHRIHLRWEGNLTRNQTIEIYRNGKLICMPNNHNNEMIDDNLQMNTFYEYQISISDICGRKVFSEKVCVKTLNKIIKPSNLQLYIAGKDEVFVSWNDNACNEKGFLIYRDGKLVKQLGSNKTSYLDKVKTSSQHQYKVVAFNDGDKVATNIKTSDVFRGDILISSHPNHFFNVDKKQPLECYVSINNELANIYLYSLKDGKKYPFSLFLNQNNQEKNNIVYRLVLNSLEEGEYRICLEGIENRSYTIWSNIPFKKSYLHNFSRIIFKNLKENIL